MAAFPYTPAEIAASAEPTAASSGSNITTISATEPYTPLSLETPGADVIIKNISVTDVVDDYGDHGITAMRCNIQIETNDHSILPPEVAESVQQLRRVASQGDPEKSNTMRVSIGRDFSTALYTVIDQAGRPHEFTGEMKGKPAISADTEGARVSWKIEVTLSGRRLGELAESVKREVHMTIESLQPELFADHVQRGGLSERGASGKN